MNLGYCILSAKHYAIQCNQRTCACVLWVVHGSGCFAWITQPTSVVFLAMLMKYDTSSALRSQSATSPRLMCDATLVASRSQGCLCKGCSRPGAVLLRWQVKGGCSQNTKLNEQCRYVGLSRVLPSLQARCSGYMKSGRQLSSGGKVSKHAGRSAVVLASRHTLVDGVLLHVYCAVRAPLLHC